MIQSLAFAALLRQDFTGRLNAVQMLLHAFYAFGKPEAIAVIIWKYGENNFSHLLELISQFVPEKLEKLDSNVDISMKRIQELIEDLRWYPNGEYAAEKLGSCDLRNYPEAINALVSVMRNKRIDE